MFNKDNMNNIKADTGMRDSIADSSMGTNDSAEDSSVDDK